MMVNKVLFGGETVVDLTEDTVTPETLAEGATAHDRHGEEIVGRLKMGSNVTKVSELENDAGYITQEDIPHIPSKTSELTNDSGFITDGDIPTKTSDLENDSGYITEVPDIPEKTSDLENDSGFITRNDKATKDQFGTVKLVHSVVYAQGNPFTNPDAGTEVPTTNAVFNFVTENFAASNTGSETYDPTSKRTISGKGVAAALATLDIPENLSDLTDDLGDNPTHTHSQYLTEHQSLSDYAKKSDIPSIPNLSKGTTSGSGNAVTDISVSGHTITATKGSTFLSKISGQIHTKTIQGTQTNQAVGTAQYNIAHGIDTSKYTILGCIGWTNSNATMCMHSFSISGSNAVVKMRNMGTNAVATNTFTATLLYIDK